MISSLFRWELRALRRDPAFWAAILLAIGALTFALSNGTRWLAHLGSLQASAVAADAKARNDARALAAKLDAENNTTYGAFRDPRDPSGYANRVMSHFAILPATPLAALSTGQSDLLPSVLPLAPATNPALAGNSEPENPHRLLLGRFDPAFIIVHLAPLLIIALTYALVAGERERGTLALLLAQPVPPRRWMLGRVMPRVTLAAGLLALLALAFVAVTPSGGGTRSLLWFALALAYGAFWFALSLAVAVRPGPSARHALVLAALWLGFVVLAPAAINLAVKTLHPVPSRMDLVLAMRDATDAANASRSQVLAGYYEDHPELAPKGTNAAEDFTLLRVATTARVEQDLAPILTRYDEQLARQQALVGRLAFFSPALLTHTALADAAGTGLARHRDFVRQAAEHHTALRAFFTPRIASKEKFSAFDEVPVFRHVEEPTATVLRQVVPSLVILVTLTLALAALAGRHLRQPTL
jgi:ABC-2 type transport system permease protein